MKLIILAGGSGTRLWPLSKKNTPKQLQQIVGEMTLLQKTYERLRSGFAVEDIFLATGVNQSEAIAEQLPELPQDQLILEPCRRDTAAAIGLAVATIAKRFPNETIVSVHSDHYIKNVDDYIAKLKLVEKIIIDHPHSGVLVGLKPTYPETGYGYIKMKKQVESYDGVDVFSIDGFKEKPDLKTARIYFEQWEYLWNLGCFAWRADRFMELFYEHLPEVYAHLKNIQEAIGTPKEKPVLETEFAAITPLAIEYGIIEREKDLLVIPADFGWADIGHWKTVKDMLSEVKEDNVTKGKVVAIDSQNNLAYSYTGKLIAMVGVNDMVVVENGDTILVCSKERAQDVKKVVDQLTAEGMEEYL